MRTEVRYYNRMLTILHGDHIEASRAELLRITSSAKDREIRHLDGKIVDQTGLTQAIESASLFGNKPMVVIERLLSGKNKKSKEFAKIIDLLKRSPDAADIVLWEDKELDASTAKSFDGAHVRIFKIPPKIFQFLDGVRPQNAKMLLLLYEEMVSNEASELIFTMLVRRVRQLLMIAGEAIPAGLADWQRARLTKQASLFTMEQLIAMHAQLLAAEYSLKTGVSPYQIGEHIEQFLVQL